MVQQEHEVCGSRRITQSNEMENYLGSQRLLGNVVPWLWAEQTGVTLYGSKSWGCYVQTL